MLKKRTLVAALLATLASTVLSAQTVPPALTPSQTSSAFPALSGQGSYVTSYDGTLIAVSDSGPRTSPVTILLVHGFLHNSQVWFKQLNSPALTGFRIVAMDMRGHGYSDKPADPAAYADPNFQAEDIEAVIHQLGLVRPVLAGWSLGGLAVDNYLAKFGDKELSGVDLIDSVACPDSTCQQTILGAIGGFQTIPLITSTDANTALQGEIGFVNLETSGTEQGGTTLSVSDRLVLETIAHSTPQFVRPPSLAVGLADLAPMPEILQNLHVPLLVQHGQNDPLFPVSVVSGEVKLVKNATVKIYPNTAHMPFFLNPNAFNVDLRSWILTTVVPNL